MKCFHCQHDTTNDKFCSQRCTQASHNAQRKIDLVEGRYLGKHLQFRGWARELIEELQGAHCAKCGGGKEYNGKPLTLQVNHKDGVATNNVMSNLELLCPNCHSQTENYGSKNKGSTRSWRRR